jgi:hypothetical protein
MLPDVVEALRPSIGPGLCRIVKVDFAENPF